MLLIGGLKEGLTAHMQTKSLTVKHLEETSAVNRSVDSDLYTQKNRMTFRKSSGFLRRERDSNPRTREDQQFSRLPHSTTLPSLQYVPFCKGMQRYE